MVYPLARQSASRWPEAGSKIACELYGAEVTPGHSVSVRLLPWASTCEKSPLRSGAVGTLV
jgi:hypothetical protein